MFEFVAAHDGMACFFEMFGGMFVLGAVAAADVAAGQTQTQRHPFVAAYQALGATAGCAGTHVLFDLIQVRAGFLHVRPSGCAVSRLQSGRLYRFR